MCTSSVVRAACGLYGLPSGTLDSALSSAHSSLACRPQSRLQTGMQSALGELQSSGQGPRWPSHHAHPHQAQDKELVTEALCRAQSTCSGLQKIYVTTKWGLPKFNVDEFNDMVAEKWLIPDGCGVKYDVAPGHVAGFALRRALVPSPPYSGTPIHPTFLLF